MSHPNIRTFIDLSTGHLKLSTREQLQDKGRETANEPANVSHWVAPTPYGFFIYVDEDGVENHKAFKAGDIDAKDYEPDFSSDVLDCMAFAHDQGVGYIMFDEEADPVDELSYYGDSEEAQERPSDEGATTPAEDAAPAAGAQRTAEEEAIISAMLPPIDAFHSPLVARSNPEDERSLRELLPAIDERADITQQTWRYGSRRIVANDGRIILDSVTDMTAEDARLIGAAPLMRRVLLAAQIVLEGAIHPGCRRTGDILWHVERALRAAAD